MSNHAERLARALANLRAVTERAEEAQARIDKLVESLSTATTIAQVRAAATEAKRTQGESRRP